MLWRYLKVLVQCFRTRKGGKQEEKGWGEDPGFPSLPPSHILFMYILVYLAQDFFQETGSIIKRKRVKLNSIQFMLTLLLSWYSGNSSFKKRAPSRGRQNILRKPGFLP